jgi:hypothetical protein
MASIDHITLRRYGTQSSPYDPQKANEPIDDLYKMIMIINSESGTTFNSVNISKGTTSGLSERLGISLNPDGTIKPEAIVSVPIASVTFDEEGSPEDYVLIKRKDLSKLSLIESEATKVVIRSPEGNIISGNIILKEGKTSKIRVFESDNGETILEIDTIFSNIEMHEHRIYQRPSNINGNIASLPIVNEIVMPRSLKVYVNGKLLSNEHFRLLEKEETGNIYGIEILEDYANLIEDEIFIEFTCSK